MKSFYSLTIVCGLVLALGCGRPTEKIKVIPVTGRVTLDGQPLEGATVTFLPQTAEGAAAGATTDSTGNFKLQTAGAARPGAVPGAYQVTVIKSEVRELMSQEKALAEAQHKNQLIPPPTTATKGLLPARYRNPAQSGLTATVTESGKNHFEFDVKSK